MHPPGRGVFYSNVCRHLVFVFLNPVPDFIVLHSLNVKINSSEHYMSRQVQVCFVLEQVTHIASQTPLRELSALVPVVDRYRFIYSCPEPEQPVTEAGVYEL